MTSYRRTSWRDGLFLLPQHFQQSERHQEAALQVRLGEANPLSYGVLELKLDESELAGRRVVLRRCKAVLPDGLVINIPDWDEEPEGLPIIDSGDRRRSEIYLAVPEARPGVPLVSADPKRTETRFIEKELPVKDCHKPDKPAEAIYLARSNLRLLNVRSGDDLRGLTALKIAEVERRTDGEGLTWRKEYIPPCLRLGAVPELAQRGRDLCELIAGQAARLFAAQRDRGDSLAQVTHATLDRFWFSQVLYSHLPVLRHLATTPDTRPARFIEEVLRLCGAILIFDDPKSQAEFLSPSREQPYFPAYDHERIGDSFAALEAFLRPRLGYNPKELWTRIHFAAEEGLQVAALGAERQRGELYLEVRGTLSPPEHAKLPRLLKIASPERVWHLHNLDGIEMTPVNRPPMPVATQDDASYFRLVPRDPYWAEVCSAKRLALSVPHQMSRLSIDLIWVHPDVGSRGR